MDQTIETIEPAAVDHIALTVDIVSAYVSKNSVPAADLPALISSTYAALAGLSQPTTPATPTAEKLTPAQIRKSITHEALISCEDGKPYKTLRRHLTIRGLTPEAYREKWGLPKEYPMTAQSYSETRSALAKSLGLGQQRRKSAAPEPEPVAPPAEKPKRAGRPRKAKEPASV